jgi:endonuclease/exonuclease/phosphatase family metal-dependent hydrolase
MVDMAVAIAGCTAHATSATVSTEGDRRVPGTINLTWWNLQNFFDTDDDPISADFEFTPAHGWTQPVFEAKRANLADALKVTHPGELIELLAVCEIEKDSLLEDLIDHMGPEYDHLTVIHDTSGTSDLRGIDVAMAYDDRKLEFLNATSHLVHLRYRTRDLFEVRFRLVDTGEELVVIACHWPSRSRGQWASEPARIAVAENIAFLIDGHVKVTPADYEQLRALDDLAAVQARWETKVVVVGDLNDEPHDRSLVGHLLASREVERVVGETNDIDDFSVETSTYRGKEVFIYNPSWKFMGKERTGTLFIDSTPDERFPNRYQILDQLLVTRGLVGPTGLRLRPDSLSICSDKKVATPSGRPRGFDKATKKGTSDHLPLTAVFDYD